MDDCDPMFRFPVVLASLGLAINLALWSVPITLGAAALPHVVLSDIPVVSAAIGGTTATDSDPRGIRDALVALLGAEIDALHVANVALQPNPPSDLGAQATRAGHRVDDAAVAYLEVVKSILDGLPNHR